jgi:hypothetical protein
MLFDQLLDVLKIPCDTVCPNLAVDAHPFEPFDQIAADTIVRRRFVQKEQVNIIGTKLAQACFQAALSGAPRKIFRLVYGAGSSADHSAQFWKPLNRNPSRSLNCGEVDAPRVCFDAELRRQHNVLPFRMYEMSKLPLGQTEPIHSSHIEVPHPKIICGLQYALSLLGAANSKQAGASKT